MRAFGLSIQWAEGRLLQAEVVSDLGELCVVRYGDQALQLRLAKGQRQTLTAAAFV